jgi:hypothetical protein
LASVGKGSGEDAAWNQLIVLAAAVKPARLFASDKHPRAIRRLQNTVVGNRRLFRKSDIMHD